MVGPLISRMLPIFKAICLTAIAQGVVIWLRDSVGIDLPKLVASMLNQATNPTTLEAMKWIIAGIVGIGLTIIWERIARSNRRNKQEQGTEKVFIRAPDSVGLRLIGNIFRGDRTHVDARGATNFKAVDNVHLEAEGPHGRRDVRLSDALYWIIDNSGWVSDHGRDMFLSQAANALRQAARDEEITIRGRREFDRYGAGDSFDQTWEDIEPSYWRTHQFEMTAVMCAEAHYATCETEVISPGDIAAESMHCYAMLRVWNDALERRWPAANT